MSENEGPFILYVTYEGKSTSRFDRKYYLSHHLPLVMGAWGPYGLQSANAFFPEPLSDGTIAICECRFKDQAAFKAATSSEKTHEVMADVLQFTDIKPKQVKAAAL